MLKVPESFKERKKVYTDNIVIMYCHHMFICHHYTTSYGTPHSYTLLSGACTCMFTTLPCLLQSGYFLRLAVYLTPFEARKMTAA